MSLAGIIGAGRRRNNISGPATEMAGLFANGEAGDYWEAGYLPGKGLPDPTTGFQSTLIGQANGEQVTGATAGLLPRPNPNTGEPVQWRTELITGRCTLSSSLSDTFAMWVYGSCSDVGWNCWMQLGPAGPYIYNASPQYNFQAGRPVTQGVTSSLKNPSNATMLVQVEAGVGVSFYVNDVLIGTNAGISYAAGMTEFDVFALWNGGQRMNGRTRAFGICDRVLQPAERTMIHERNVHLYTVGEGLP